MSKEAGTTGHGMSWLVPHQRAAHRHGKHQIRCITSGCITGKPVTAFLIFFFSMAQGHDAVMLFGRVCGYMALKNLPRVAKNLTE